MDTQSGLPDGPHQDSQEKVMRIRFTTLIHSLIKKVPRLTLLSSLVAGNALMAAGQVSHDHAGPATLVQIVREATRQFTDVNAAGPAGYGPAFGCVSGPDHGAMGIHYINGALVVDGEIDAAHPEALIYEPMGDQRRLVGVEYIVDAATWLANHNNTPPMLEGQAFQFVGSPNRYGIPAFFELHVWAWQQNPNGAFVDWNNKVTCERQ
jgi:hypothetical protein